VFSLPFHEGQKITSLLTLFLKISTGKFLHNLSLCLARLHVPVTSKPLVKYRQDTRSKIQLIFLRYQRPYLFIAFAFQVQRDSYCTVRAYLINFPLKNTLHNYSNIPQVRIALCRIIDYVVYFDLLC
jgi:hypothetical protein